MKNIFKFIFCIILCEGIGIVAGIATSQSVSTWYQQLNKPSFNPPAFIFAPVWTILYLLMGISLFLIWKDGLKTNFIKFSFFFFIFHLFINGLWSFVFFMWHSPGWAFIVISILWIMITISILLFSKINKISAYLLLPYLIWVSFASILNFFIWKLN